MDLAYLFAKRFLGKESSNDKTWTHITKSPIFSLKIINPCTTSIRQYHSEKCLLKYRSFCNVAFFKYHLVYFTFGSAWNYITLKDASENTTILLLSLSTLYFLEKCRNEVFYLLLVQHFYSSETVVLILRINAYYT